MEYGREKKQLNTEILFSLIVQSQEAFDEISILNFKELSRIYKNKVEKEIINA